MNSSEIPASLRQQRRRNITAVVGLCLFWYLVTVIESWITGFHPLAIRPITPFDFGFFAAIWTGLFLVGYSSKCPSCRDRLGLFSIKCKKCGPRATKG
ncbi:MAG: hypothetical protein V1736_14000 [Pseudomonadota bacterium]